MSRLSAMANEQTPPKHSRLTQDQLKEAISFEGEQFKTYFLWLENHMPPQFFEEFEAKHLMTIAHNLMGFNLQGNFIQIHFENCSIVLCLDSPDVDLRILKNYAYFGIKNYQTFISDEPPPLPGCKKKLRIAILHFTQLTEDDLADESVLSKETKDECFRSLREKNPTLSREEFDTLIGSINSRFLRVLNQERLILVLDMFFRARIRDHLQYEVKYNEDWQTAEKDLPSMRIVLAWKNTPKYYFLYRLAKLIYRHKLVMKRVNAAYIQPHSNENILLMSLALHGQENKAAWEVTDIKDFLQELACLKYFEDGDKIEELFVNTHLLSGNQANILRTISALTHQLLLHIDQNLYSKTNVDEGLLCHPELTIRLMRAFEHRFNPEIASEEEFEKEKNDYMKLVDKLDTGNLFLDTRRKNVLKTAMHFISFTLKTNAYRNNKSALAFRIDPLILETLPFDRKEKFPELPYGIFFIRGRSFIGFHIRFKDLARGGLRTVFPWKKEQAEWERANIFSECYNLAYTQQKKNKDIPEGGSKAVIFIEPFEEMSVEQAIYQKELQLACLTEDEIQQKIHAYQNDQRTIFLYAAQRSFVYSLLTLINCHDDGRLKARDILDYLKKPEYLYLGPDENMHNCMLEWIAEHAKLTGYKPGKAFISSKPTYGINHKQFGVTSLGVNVCMHQVLKHLGIDPEKDPFTIKISGGPDGDVAGNQILNLHKFYPNTAKLLAITDVSGTIFDPEGLDLSELTKLFFENKPIRFYPPEKLNDGGYLLDLQTKRDQNEYSQQTLCYRKHQEKVVHDWLIGNDTHHLFSHNLHQTITDIFIPGGGRPRTLNASNWKDFLDPVGEPTSRAIVEGANLYLTQEARDSLENLGVMIIKDSSANKGGVICSSLEVLSCLILSEEEFAHEKDSLMKEILAFIREKAFDEVTLMLRTHEETGMPLTTISELISEKINTFTYQILDHLETTPLSQDQNNPLNQCLIDYCPTIFRNNPYKNRLFTNIPAIQQKAMISCYIASRIVYNKGLNWSPSIVEILPLIVQSFKKLS